MARLQANLACVLALATVLGGVPIARAAEPVATIAGQVVNEDGRPLVEGVKVWLCGLEKKRPDGTWDVNQRPHCLMPRAAIDEQGRFRLAFEASSFELPIDPESIRANFWFESEGYAPTYVAGLSPRPTDQTVTIRRGTQISGKVERRVAGMLEPVDGAAVELRCLAGDVEHQRQYFRDPLGSSMRERGDLGYRHIVFTDSGQYVTQLTPAPPGRHWFVVCLDEAVMLDFAAGEKPKGPDFVVEVTSR